MLASQKNSKKNSCPQLKWAYVLEKSPLPIANNGKISTFSLIH
jgi:hypothetical protein